MNPPRGIETWKALGDALTQVETAIQKPLRQAERMAAPILPPVASAAAGLAFKTLRDIIDPLTQSAAHAKNPKAGLSFTTTFNVGGTSEIAFVSGIKVNVEGAKTTDEVESVARGLAKHWPWALRLAFNGFGEVPALTVVFRDLQQSRGPAAKTKLRFDPNQDNYEGPPRIELFRLQGRIRPDWSIERTTSHEFGHVLDFILYMLVKDNFENNAYRPQYDFYQLSKRAGEEFYHLGFERGNGDAKELDWRGTKVPASTVITPAIANGAFSTYWFRQTAAKMLLNTEEQGAYEKALADKNEAEIKRLRTLMVEKAGEFQKTKFGNDVDFPDYSIENEDAFKPSEFFPQFLSAYVHGKIRDKVQVHHAPMMKLMSQLENTQGDPQRILAVIRQLDQILNGSAN